MDLEWLKQLTQLVDQQRQLSNIFGPKLALLGPKKAYLGPKFNSLGRFQNFYLLFVKILILNFPRNKVDAINSLDLRETILIWSILTFKLVFLNFLHWFPSLWFYDFDRWSDIFLLMLQIQLCMP